ncbi:MAG: MetS family NSS transporter small subunit [Bacteroidota bacterium]
METATVVTMVVVVGTVWGGFLTVLLTALKKEKQKSGEGE